MKNLKLRWILFKNFISICIQKVFGMFTPIKTEINIVEKMIDAKIEKQQSKPTDPLKLYRVPQDGNDWNPLLKYPRNESCFCGSKIKAKRCCLPKLPIAVKKEVADAAAPLVKVLRTCK